MVEKDREDREAEEVEETKPIDWAVLARSGLVMPVRVLAEAPEKILTWNVVPLK